MKYLLFSHVDRKKSKIDGISMLQTVEAIVKKDGTVRLLEPVHPAQSMRAVLTLLEPVNVLPAQTQTPLHTFAGLLKDSPAFSGDPMKIQRELRNEWN